MFFGQIAPERFRAVDEVEEFRGDGVIHIIFVLLLLWIVVTIALRIARAIATGLLKLEPSHEVACAPARFA